MEKPIAVIDLGSNSLRMSVSRVCEDGKWETLAKLRETVRLGQGMRDGNLCAKAVEEVLSALERFALAAAAAGCGDIIATATQAVRIAKNRDSFLSMAKERAGIDFRVLTGEEEAAYSFLAVKETLPIDNGVLFDTGGGSTEIILVKNRRLIKSVSTPCGAVMLTEEFKDRPFDELYEKVKAIISAVDWLKEAKGSILYGIGGSARTLGCLYEKRRLDLGEINGLEISSAAVKAVFNKVKNTPPEQRRDIEGMDKSRADVILAGLTPAAVLTELLGSPKLVLCAYGVKEGVFFEKKNEIIKKEPVLNVVLVEPEIPQNTGNIARTCAAVGAALHIVKPMGFEISDRNLKRAGLDYWNMLDVYFYENTADFFERTKGGRYRFATTKAPKTYTEAEFSKGDYILFGRETKGLPEELLKKNIDSCIRIPMVSGARSLNLGNSAAVVVYEALRQMNFPNLKVASESLV